MAGLPTSDGARTSIKGCDCGAALDSTLRFLRPARVVFEWRGRIILLGPWKDVGWGAALLGAAGTSKETAPAQASLFLQALVWRTWVRNDT